MKTLEQHQTPDGALTFIVVQDADGDLSLGFEGFGWHTHGDLLAAVSGCNEEAAVRQFVSTLLAGQMPIAVLSIGGNAQDVWISDDPAKDMKDLQPGEALKIRNWDGQPWPLR